MPASTLASGFAAPDEWRVTVATLNVYFENRSPEPAVKAIRESKADAVFLQETTSKIEQLLRKELKDLYPYTVFKGGGGRIPTDRFGVLARSPIEKTRFLPPRSGLFGTLVAQTVMDGRRLQLVNVHLKPLQLQPNARPAQHLQAFKALDKAHTAELGFILKSIDPKLPTIIAGDFNSIPPSSGPRLLAEKGYVDAFKLPSTNPAENEEGSGTPTWQIDTELGPIRLRIDYIFCSKDLTAVTGKVIPDTGSDHRLVVAEIGLPKGDASTQPATTAGP
ncbi:MAG TPA: endonuclease/exonuclease/phosphatase family protein [Phycisphaerae bacterium]|nr:endonuclease/exonuclease/phosphatase family protein [Phycisphaerae bacterium]HRR84130.1 endonuclease/exonuclease/phosphatase family protein [Phycisphaerae bacterium]